ncbi:MarR family transcriptional regulator [Rhodosalinus halophilus]|uniref:MarR family transcriptional regulator n=1 Tax=Rhodosalinus halophilus TaxID=2259333 RepID=A0A365UAE7_9RHOB|nr:MarR family transcriptional regulator [Rhodosalinus halophilus]RBI85428.1 MarR family transcriptional regulator [Rhodosalinus halophilus]
MRDLYRMPGHLIRRMHQISVSVFAARMRAAGQDLTPVQFAALAALSAHSGVDQATLAGLIAYDRVTLGGVVDRLEAKGYLVREVSETDRRARILRLTPEGEAALDRARPVVDAVQDEMLAGLTRAERDELLRLLHKAAEAGNARSRAPLRAPQAERPAQG